MATIISTKTSGVGGLEVTGDATGILQLASNNGTTAVTVDASQNVGIGTASPTQKLDIRTNTTGDTNINIWNEYSGAAYAANVNLIAANTSGSYYNAVIAKNSSGTATWRIDGAGAADTFRISTGSGYTERMRIDSSGNVFTGTTSQLAGTSGFNISNGNGWSLGIRNTANSSGINITNGSGTAAYTAIGFYNNGLTYSGCGSINVSGTTTSYATSSDYRLKENITPMTGALNSVLQLNPVTYTWKSTSEEGQGFIAHELQSVVPDCVIGEKDAVDADGNPIYQGIDTSFLVATLTAAIQELKAIIDTQAERIAVLENK